MPFISQIEALPSVLRHRMSALPSPLKSPTPAIVQLVGTTPSPPPLACVRPFISQIEALPSVLRHRMSLLPSALKSLRVDR